jgi:F-type H+-transporting ATPase subunit epsilon
VSEKLQFELVTPHGSVYSGEVDEVTAPGSEGEFGVLPGHAPYITTLRTGLLICKSGGQNIYFFVSWGYAEVGPDKVVVLADSAERAEDIDIERARDARKRAEEILKRQEEENFASAEAALERAMFRVNIHEMHGKK